MCKSMETKDKCKILQNKGNKTMHFINIYIKYNIHSKFIKQFAEYLSIV